jgi:hypothetical protein
LVDINLNGEVVEKVDVIWGDRRCSCWNLLPLLKGLLVSELETKENISERHQH